MNDPDARLSILYLRSSVHCTGLERRLLLLADAARRAGFAPRLAVLYRPNAARPPHHPLIARAEACGVPIIQIADPSPLAWSPLRQIGRLIREYRPAIIHTQDYRTDFLAWVATRSERRPPALVATCHGHTAASGLLRTYEALDRRILRSFDRVIGASHYQCRLMAGWGIPSSYIAWVPHPVEPAWQENLPPAIVRRVRERLDVSENEVLIGYFGRNSPEKGLETLLAAFQRVRVEHPTMRLAIFGEAPSPKRLPAGAVHAGYVDDVRPAMQACDLIVIPSQREAFGLVALEALALGRPVIASRVGGLAEIVRHGETGRLVEPADPDSLASAIREARRDWPATLLMAQRGRQDVWARFPACEILQDMIALYHSVQKARYRRWG